MKLASKGTSWSQMGPGLLVAIAALLHPTLGASADTFPGALPLKFEDRAGPVHITGELADIRVLLNGKTIFEDKESRSAAIAAAFPDWTNPSTVVVGFSSGGTACDATYRVLDVRSGHLTEEIGNCSRLFLRQSQQELVFAFPGRPAHAGWAYRDGKVSKIPNLTPEQHVRSGIEAYQGKNYTTALRHFWVSRDSRFPDAAYHLGLMAHAGNGVAQDYAVAMAEYQVAAEMDHAPAIYRIGVLHANGRGVPRNPAEAMRWYTRAAELNDGLAQYNTGLGYLKGSGVAKDAQKALHWLLLANDRISDPKIAEAVRKDIRAVESQLDPRSVEAVRDEARSWKPKIASKESDPAKFTAWIGKYPFDRVGGMRFLEQADVQTQVSQALGRDAIGLMQQMEVATPIQRIDGWLIASSCMAHNCPDTKWLIALNLSDLTLRACLAPFNTKSVRFGGTGKKMIEVSRQEMDGCPEPEDALAAFQDFLDEAKPQSSGAPAAPAKSEQAPGRRP